MGVTEHLPGRGVAARARSSRLLASWRSGPWTRPATALALVVVILVVVGLTMSFSASFVDAAEGGDPFDTFQRQLAWSAVGVPVFFLVAALDYRVWRPASWLLLAASVAGLVAVLVGFGLTEGGSTRWLPLGPLVVQPSEVAKLATLLWLGDVYTRKRDLHVDLRARPGHVLVPALPLLAIVGGLVMLEPDLGTALLLAVIVGIVVWLEGLPLWVVTLFGATATAVGLAAAVLEPYRFARITGWLDPTADPLGDGYQLLQSLYALGSGGWFGVGIGSSRGKWNYVPNPETDFIFAILGEELGLVGALAVLALFAALLVIGLRVAREAPDHFGQICAYGVTGFVVGQALLNVSTVTGLLPITGVTLPLVSVGGSSLVSTLAALGILVAVARRSAVVGGPADSGDGHV